MKNDATPFYLDVHTHLTHEKFSLDVEEVVLNATNSGLGAMVVNGLNPESNRYILELSQKHPTIIPAMGIYPTEAVNKLIVKDYQREVAIFDCDQEIAYIREQAKQKKIKAVGECGLDGYYLESNTFAEQERVWQELIQVAMDYDLPVIVHSRKLERRCLEILASLGAKKVVMHCFGGKTKLAQQYAEKHQWCFSIPANCTVNEAFQSMLSKLPEECILTETDAPYLAPVRGERNEPKNVVITIEMMAKIRGCLHEDAKKIVWQNYNRLFA